MSEPELYRGLWPQNVSKMSKYTVKFDDGKWKVMVRHDIGEGLVFLAVEGSNTDIPDCVNNLKRQLTGQEGGAFYVNEFHHLIIPVSRNGSSQYYCGGKVDPNFVFEFEGQKLTSKPVNQDGSNLTPGDIWVGPRPGIPYVLAASGNDIYFETPAVTSSTPPELREGVTKKVKLSKVLNDGSLVAQATKPIATVRGQQGGRFYVNEHQSIFTPVDRKDGNGLEYIYCGQIDFTAWFPEPPLSSF
jgi:hypothetical protein